jgi:hypothetical protein
MNVKISMIILVFGLAVTSLLSADEAAAVGKNSRTFNVRDFNSIKNRTGADLEIRLGEDWKIEAAGNRRGVRNLRIFKRDGELIIGSRFSIFLTGRIIYRPVHITICMPESDIESVTATGSGNANIIGNLQSDKTNLKTTARGSITAAGNVEYLTLKSSASGNITFEGNSRELEVTVSASGDANLKIQTDMLIAKISSSGSIYISGKARNSDIHITARGSFFGSDFSSDYADVRISASGDAELRIEEEVQSRLSARGSLYYWGNPEITGIRTSGKGGLVSME